MSNAAVKELINYVLATLILSQPDLLVNLLCDECQCPTTNIISLNTSFGFAFLHGVGFAILNVLGFAFLHGFGLVFLFGFGFAFLYGFGFVFLYGFGFVFLYGFFFAFL